MEDREIRLNEDCRRVRFLTDQVNRANDGLAGMDAPFRSPMSFPLLLKASDY